MVEIQLDPVYNGRLLISAGKLGVHTLERAIENRLLVWLILLRYN